MQDFKISLITVTYNAEGTISRCIESVIAQNYKNLEYIIIDGGSSDNTIQIINQYNNFINLLISEPDNGVYDAINKGILHATGDIVGLLNADDFFADNDILNAVAAGFNESGADIIYGNLHYVNLQGKIIRKWNTNEYAKGIFNWGWMPPHPTFYCKRKMFSLFGLYSTEYGTAGDYELMLRFMHANKAKVFKLDRVMVNMQCGGMSNKFPINRIQAWGNDLKAMRKNKIKFPFLTLFMKPLRKMGQYL